MAKRQSICDSCGRKAITQDYSLVLNFGMRKEGRERYVDMLTYNQEKTRKQRFFGFPACYLQVGLIALCGVCRETLSGYFCYTVYGFGLEINKLLTHESKEAVAKIISSFGRWVIEFLKRQVEGLYEKYKGKKNVGISYESLNAIFASHKIKSKLVLSALNELVEEKFLVKTKEAETTVFWGPVRVERIQIDLSAPAIVCAGEIAHFSLKSTHGGFVRISLLKNSKKITEIDQEVAANKERIVDIQFPAPGNYKVLSKYLRVEKARPSAPPGLILKSTEATKELKVKVRVERPLLDIENPFVDALNPAKLNLVTSQDITMENIAVDIDDKRLRGGNVQWSQGKLQVSLRGVIETTPGVHLLSLTKIEKNKCSCPATAEVIAFVVERPKGFRLGEKNKIRISFPRSREHTKMRFEVGWKGKDDSVSGVLRIPRTGKIELETPILERVDDLILNLQNPVRPTEKAKFMYPIDVEPTKVKVECKPVEAGSTFTVKVMAPELLLDQLKTQVIRESTRSVQIEKQRIANNCILLEGLADSSGEYVVNLQSSIPFKIEGDKGFYVRVPPKLITDKRGYKTDELVKLTLRYDPRTCIETILATVSYYDYFSMSKESIRFEKTKTGSAEAIVQALPPCSAEIIVEVVYKEGVKDILKKDVDIYGVLFKGTEP